MTLTALDSALTAPLFATDAMRACFSDTARLAAMLRVEAALARAEARLGLAPDGLAAAIEAIDPASLDAAAIGEATVLSAVPSIPFIKAVQSRLPAALASALHKGATTQDLLDTALVLLLQDALALIETDLRGTLNGLLALAAHHRLTPCAGRTYGQQGAPLTFGYKAAIWAAGLAEAADRLPALRIRLRAASLAGPVGTLAGLGADGPAVLDAFAAELGLAAPPVAWHARRGRFAEAGCWLAELIGALAKMAGDVANLASTEVGEVAEPYLPGRGGSSAMPHKRNPVSCTVILSAHTAAPGLAATLLTAMQALHERPAGAWQGEWHALPPLFGLASGALREARSLAEGLEVDAIRMRANLDVTRGLLFADAAAARLAPSLGRAAAHALVEHAAGLVRQTGEHLAAILARDPATAGVDLAPAFDLTPAIQAAALWTDRALEDVRRTIRHLRND
jgi:3-carboxy-cis,cis-muconate cycloisomerase